MRLDATHATLFAILWNVYSSSATCVQNSVLPASAAEAAATEREREREREGGGDPWLKKA